MSILKMIRDSAYWMYRRVDDVIDTLRGAASWKQLEKFEQKEGINRLMELLPWDAEKCVSEALKAEQSDGFARGLSTDR